MEAVNDRYMATRFGIAVEAIVTIIEKPRVIVVWKWLVIETIELLNVLIRLWQSAGE